MKRLARAITQKGAGGRPLPPVFTQLDQAKIKFRKAEVSMLAGDPGAGKSLLALWIAIQWVKTHGLRGIYFSADSAELGQASRALAMVSNYGLSIDQAERMVEARDQQAIKDMECIKDLMWSFENDVQYESINEEILAFVELWGTTPDFIIIDNLTDVDGQAEDEYGHMRRVMKGLTQLARETGSHVMVLHHTSEDPRIRSEPCPPKWAIQGKVSQKPALILTTANGWLACVKNRFGPDDRTGRTAYRLGFNAMTMQFSERGGYG